MTSNLDHWTFLSDQIRIESSNRRVVNLLPGSLTDIALSADIEKWLQAQDNEPFVLSQVSVARKVKKTD
jgi:hypothetical protein